MQRLLTLVLLALAGSLTAQDIIWQEDFSRGFQGWTANPLICGSNPTAGDYGDVSGPEFGIWNLQGGTLNGMAIDYGNLSARWTFINPSEYQFILDSEDGANYATVYGKYSITEGDTLVSSVDPGVTLSGLEFDSQTPTGEVNYGTVAQLASGTLTDLVKLHIGVGDPTVVLTDGGNTLTYTITDGADEYVFTYAKSNECGTLWVWSPNGNADTGLFGLENGQFVDSDTRDNGTMVMRNMWNMFEGMGGIDPGGFPYPFYVSELISPPIDLSAVNGAVSLSVTQTLAYLNTPDQAPNGIRTSFQISTDDGLTWSDAFDLNDDLGFNTARDSRQTIPIPSSLLAGVDEIRLKLTFASDYYYWGIDDVTIEERIGYDMQVNENFFAVPDNYATPWSQLQPQYFMSDIQNNGGQTAENVMLKVSIADGDGMEIFTATKDYGDIIPDSLAENDFFDETFSLPAEPASLGGYTGQYTISHDSLDAITDNDTLNFSFIVTDTLFAKEFGRTRDIAPLDEPAYYYGNCYYVPNGENWYARTISFSVENISSVLDNGGVGTVTTHLYELPGDVDGSGLFEVEEYGGVGIAFNEYEFDGSEDQVLITIPVDLEGEGVELTGGNYYMAVVQYAGTDNDNTLFMSASESIDYNANGFITDSIGIPQYHDVVGIGIDPPTFFSGGFTGSSVAVVRLSIGDNPFLDQSPITNVETVLPDNYGVNVFPNPANEAFNMDLDFPDAQDVMVRLYDQTGRVLIQQEFDGVQQARYNYDVSTIPAGIYFIQLDTDAGSRIEKVVVQH